MVFTVTDKASKQLQSSTLTAQSASGTIDYLKQCANDFRNDAAHWEQSLA